MRGDARLLRRLVRNLLENARRHGGAADRGRASARRRRRRACCASATAARACRRPSASAIFEPFYRLAGARDARAGVGLGLALVRQIARTHGGDVRCRPRDGGGSCFEIALPA